MEYNFFFFTPILFKRNITSFSLALILSFPVFSQKHDKSIAKADENFEAFAYIDARAIYMDVINQGYASKDLYAKLADSFYFTSDLEDAVQWYEKLIEASGEEVNPEYLFRYSQCLKSVERYQESDDMMERFNSLTQNDKRAKFFIEKKDYLDFIELQSGKFEMFSLSINTKNSEYAPSFDANNKIVFASSREKINNPAKLHKWDKMPFLDIFSSEVESDQIGLKEPVKLKGKINTKFHESSTSFSRDGTTMYFSRNNYTNNKLGTSKKGVVLLKLYKATLIDGKWTNVTELPFCSDNYSVSHPSLSTDGKKLYFASDMPGTFGKSDLYVVDVLGGGRFGKPKNLGENINTEGRETFPYISNSGRLYFASDGHVGLGGLDVFVAEPKESGFSDAFNVGKPINSPKDDFTFVLNEETKIGYFASNRKGGKGNDDIYSFKQNEELITSCKQYIDGRIVDIETNSTLSGADIILWDENRAIVDRAVSDSFGRYKFVVECEKQYEVQVGLAGYTPENIGLRTTDVLEYTNAIVVPLQPIKEEVLSPLAQVNLGDDLGKTLLLEPIYFGLDDATITPETEIELQKIIAVMKKYPDLKIEVRSHTDSRSSFWYNKRLSVKRMRATISYIVRKGEIYWKRIRGKAYGERRLINKCGNDVPCTEEEHQENRRSEFIVRK